MTDSERVLVWAPRGRDGALAAQLLTRAGLTAEECGSIADLIARMASVGCAVITAETLNGEAREAFAEALSSQPPWSDFPIVLFAPRGADRADEVLGAVKLLGNVTILDRPVHSGTLVSAVVAALRGRRRQYEAREAIHRRDQFLAMLGHELRNPLAAIVLALETMPPIAADPAAKQRLIIDRQARHLARLVDDLLDVARVTSGKVRLLREAIDLNEIVRRCVHGAELAARTRSIELREQLTPGTLIVDGDLVRLEEVFTNLIANAIKYSPTNSRIDIRTSDDAGRCTVEIVDRGIGIAPDMLERVFDLFAQADSSLDRSQGGLGVGLTLVRSLVELHDGSVEAASAGIGHGSTFIVRIPASASAVRKTSGSHLSLVAPGPVSVVLVEDNPDLLEMTKDLLESMGCAVATAADGTAGLAQIVAACPDIAFVDIGLPGLDGYQIANRVRQQLGGDLFLVAMTGYGQPEDQQRTRDAGFDLHLTKPVTATLLREGLAACAKVRPAGPAQRSSRGTTRG